MSFQRPSATQAPTPPRRAGVRLPVRTHQIAVMNPSSGARLAVTASAPETAGLRPVVVLVPGGLSSGEGYFGAPGIARRMAGLGYTVVHFDPEGRGHSGGREDYNGPAQQDGLAAVVGAAMALQGADPSGVVLMAFCYGTSMAAGALARHPELPVRLFLDWEGPPRRGDVRSGAGLLGWALPAESRGDGEWWLAREAAAFMDRVAVPYQRVQSAPDHLRTDPAAALEMLRLATAREYGGRGTSPWTRLNGNRPNRAWDVAEPAQWLPRLPGETAVLPYLVELAPPAF